MHQAKTDPIVRTSHPVAWVAAIAAMAIATVASGSCFFSSATNVCANGRRCNPGQTCAPNQDICVDIDGCGNDHLDPGEVCDDGNVLDGDGCSASCKSDETCGNGTTDTINPEDPKETCDDGNTTAGDGCSNECKEENCGDRIYNPDDNEDCDTGGNTPACNGADGFCTLSSSVFCENTHCKIPRCGDGYTNTAFTPFMATAPEECDEATIDTTTALSTIKSMDTQTCNGNNNGFEGLGSCRTPKCGDGYVNTNFVPNGAMEPEQCDEVMIDMTTDPPAITSIDTPECNGNNGTIGSCRQSPVCGDGYANTAIGEECDSLDGKETSTNGATPGCNGNTDDAIASGVNCKFSECGDGYINKTDNEECDTLGGNDTEMCNGATAGTVKCRFSMCRDGHKNSADSEQCEIDADCDLGESCNMVDCQCIEGIRGDPKERM